ncbi:MAG: beta strand repeat-containing protein, partial [Bacteriovoracaceae bacterium]
VTVTGVPSINLTFDECTVAGAQTRQAKYASGSGTTTLRFTYSVENDCNETAGGMPLTTSIQLNGGTIKDLAGHAAPLDFSAFLSSPIANTTQVRGRYPLISGIVSPAAGTYAPGGNLDFTLNFDRAVTVSGTTPYFNIKIGTDATKQATYLSGSGTTQFIFRYTVVVGDIDNDGVDIAGPLINEGSICSGAFCLVNNETDILSLFHYATVKVYAPVPAITSITLPSPLPASGYYKLGDTVQVVVGFTEAVTVSGGTPLLSSVVGATSRDFTYLSGSGTSNLIFNYTIQNTDLDTDGVNFTTPLVLNGATIQNAQGTNADLDFTFTINPGFRFDGVQPTITASVINGAVATNHPDYRLNQFVYIDLTFSESVTVTGSTISLTVGATARTASYFSSVTPTVKRYRYQVQTTDHTLNQAATLTVGTTLTGGTIQDVALNDINDRTIPATDTTGVDIDGKVPTVSSVTLPSNGTTYGGQNVDFTVVFSEPVTVSGTPTWAMTLDAGGPESLSYVSGSGTSSLLFRMTVDSNDLDTTGIAVATAFTLGGATIVDSSVGNSLTNSIPAQNTSGIKIDGVGPTVTNITGPASGTYIEATNLDFTVTYSEAATITGSPELVLDIGGVTKYATYLSGSGTANVIYRYTVETNLNDKDGVQVTSHILNSGTITDVGGNPATLTISTYSYGTAFVDSQGPKITSITPPGNGVKISGDTLSFTVNFDENTTVAGGTPTLALDIGGVTLSASYASGSGTTALVFTTAALNANHFDADGIAYSGTSLALNGATLRDTYNHNATLTFTAGNISGIKVIYSEVLSWLDVSTSGAANGAAINSLTDLSPAGNNASSNAGTVTKISADVNMSNRPSASFDGVSSLLMGTLTVKTIAIAFRARSAPSNTKLVADASKGLVLVNGTDMDFGGANARYAIDGAAFGASVASCTSCYDSTTTKVIMIRYSTPQSMTALLGDSFDGEIAEVWLLSGAQGLTTTQTAKIGAYLASKY